MPIHIAIAFDQNYLQPFYALITSLFLNNAAHKMHLHLIATGIDIDKTNAICNYAEQNGVRISFYEINQTEIKDFVVKNEWTLAVYYRLYFPLLVSTDIDRLLYLDTDTIVIGDIAELFNHTLSNKPLGAVYDLYVKEQKLIGVSKGDYFNSGVLLMDVKKWREQNISEKVFHYLATYRERTLYVDQCGLNAVLKGNWEKLDYRFNLLYTYLPTELSLKELRQFISNKVVVHYTLQRPWYFLCKNRLRYLYWQYLRMSPLADKRSKVFDDFSLLKIPAWLQIRITETYLDSPRFQKIWRMIRG